jgi:hypothetical protein
MYRGIFIIFGPGDPYGEGQVRLSDETDSWQNDLAPKGAK